jgi:hypothetical protein
MNKSSKNRWLVLGLSFCFVIILTLSIMSCGGGGDGEGISDGDSGIPSQTVNQETSQQIIGITMLSQEISSIGTDLSDYDIPLQITQDTQSLNIAGRILKKVEKEIPLFNETVQIAGNESGQLICDTGSASYSLSWDGPSYPEYCWDIRNPQVNLTLYNCVEGSTNMNGSVSLSYSGDLCSPPSAFAIYFSNLSLSDPSLDLYFYSSSFQLSFTEAEWISLTIPHVKVTFNGDLSASYRGDDYSVSYSNFFLILDSNDFVNFQVTLGGSLTGGCLNGWYTLETIEPVLINIYQECPTGGKVKILGNGEMIYQFNSDGSVNIGDTYYSSCLVLDRACPAL